jgi:hypothetical protein
MSSWGTQNDGSDGDLRIYGRRAAEAMDAAVALDRSIYELIGSETDKATRDELTMVRILALKRREEFVTQVADIYASAYGLDELKTLVAFLESPAGEAMRKKQPDVEVRIRQATTAFLDSIMK